MQHSTVKSQHVESLEVSYDLCAFKIAPLCWHLKLLQALALFEIAAAKQSSEDSEKVQKKPGKKQNKKSRRIGCREISRAPGRGLWVKHK